MPDFEAFPLCREAIPMWEEATRFNASNGPKSRQQNDACGI
jgi:hypothetical protein